MERRGMKASLVFAIVLIFIAIFIYSLAYRNIDTGLNMCIIEKELNNTKILDYDFLGRAYSFTDVYQLGLRQYFSSLFFFIIAVIILLMEVTE
jgi:hypothetical protein